MFQRLFLGAFSPEILKFLIQPNQINFTPGAHLLPTNYDYPKKTWDDSGYLKNMINIFFASRRNLVTKECSSGICQGS
jgi:hypothetical protein